MPSSHFIFIPAVFLIGGLTGVVGAHYWGRVPLARSTATGHVRPIALARTLGVFLMTFVVTHLLPVPGGVLALRSSVNHQKLFDQNPAFSPDETYRRIVAFGQGGRDAYQQFTHTSDLMFPLALFLFLFVLARFVGERVAPAKGTRIMLSAAPIVWFISDLVENGTVYLLLSTYPTRHAVASTLLPYVTVSKFALLVVSFGLPLVVSLRSLHKDRLTEASA